MNRSMAQTQFRVRHALVSLTLAALLAAWGCSTAPEPAAEAASPGEGLTPEQAALADDAPVVRLDLEASTLPNGQSVAAYAAERSIGHSTPADPESAGYHAQTPSGDVTGPQQRKRDVITAMLEEARWLTDPSWWHYAAEGDDAPEQDHLAYSYGQKDPYVRAKAPAGTCNKARIHGMDCSGFLSQIARNANILLPAGPASLQGDPATWNELMPEAWGLRIEEVSDGVSSPAVGDVIAWPGHIGVIARGPADAWVVLQSNGVPGPETDACTKNRGPRRGVRGIELSKALGAFGAHPKLLRLTVDMSGDWNFSMRCAGQATDAQGTTLTLAEEGGRVTGAGTGTDYDGTALSFTLDASYDAAASALAGRIATSDEGGTQPRLDDFQVTLGDDDSGYFALTTVQLAGGTGCDAEARLVRVMPKPSQGE